MRYLSWAGKSGLLVFWLGLLICWIQPLTKPFGLLLGGLALLLLMGHLLGLFGAGRKPWSERLQILLFGAFHLPVSNVAIGETSLLPTAEHSEVQAGASETDQQQTDQQV